MSRLYTLSPRLSAAAAYLPPGARLADIGCDHARLPVYAALRLGCGRVIACDLREAPLARARQTCLRFGAQDRVELRLGDGLSPVKPDECTHITICGMGGDTIAAILEAAPWTREGGHTLILQPESSAHKLRRFLYENGYAVLDERAVRDANRVYTVLCVRGGAEPAAPSLLDTFASPSLREKHDAAAREYLARVRASLADRKKGETAGGEAYLALEAAERELERENGEDMAD